jgi:pilus assembly protein Flp/PilA
MNRLWAAIREFVRQDDGPTAVEYAVMLSLILVVCMAGIRSFGTATSSTFTRAATSLNAATSGS